jgi:hypothetical protein
MPAAATILEVLGVVKEAHFLSKAYIAGVLRISFIWWKRISSC